MQVCFERGRYCAVGWSGTVGFVEGERLAVDDTGKSVLEVETERWAKIDAGEGQGRLPDWESSNIVVWGDSLSTNTFGNALELLLPGRDVSLQGVPGEDGASIAKRRLATDAYDGRITVIWDRHYTGEDPDRYMGDLQPIFARLQDERYVVISDIRSMAPDIDAAKDQRITEAVNERLRTAHPASFLDLTVALEDPATRTDGLHLTPAANEVVAGELAAFITAKGW